MGGSAVKNIEKILGPAWIVYMTKIVAAVHHKEEALRDATIPLIREFRKDGDIKPIIRAACEVLGDDFLDTVDWESDHFPRKSARQDDGSPGTQAGEERRSSDTEGA